MHEVAQEGIGKLAVLLQDWGVYEITERTNLPGALAIYARSIISFRKDFSRSIFSEVLFR